MTHFLTQGLLTPDDLLDNETFSKARTRIFQEVVALKKIHRLFLGKEATLLFESKFLVWWQVQEMLRIEKGDALQAVEELEVYNVLIPGNDNLTATLMLEIEDPEKRKKQLQSLVGVEQHISLLFGNHKVCATSLVPPSLSIPAKASSVCLLKFSFSPETRADFCSHFLTPQVCITHPYYHASASISLSLWEHLKSYLAT